MPPSAKKFDRLGKAGAQTPFSLSQPQIEQIRYALNEARPYGEVRLVVTNDKLRFIRVLRSIPAIDTLVDSAEG